MLNSWGDFDDLVHNMDKRYTYILLEILFNLKNNLGGIADDR